MMEKVYLREHSDLWELKMEKNMKGMFFVIPIKFAAYIFLLLVMLLLWKWGVYQTESEFDKNLPAYATLNRIH